MQTIPIPPEVQAKIDAFTASKAAFLELQSRQSDLETQAANQTALAETAEAEANQHQETLRGLVRDMVRSETGDREAVSALAAKVETARTLAAEHRSFAADLLAEAEEVKSQSLKARDEAISNKKKALTAYANFQFKAILGSIEQPLLKAMSFRLHYYKVNGNYSADNIHDSFVFDIGKYIKPKFSGHQVNGEDEILSLLT